MRLALVATFVALVICGCGKKQANLPPFVKMASGLQYRDIKQGTGSEAKAGDSVTVHYKGWLDNGKVFDHSRKPGAGPLSFVIDSGSVIKGWEEGIKGMKVGGVRELIVPPALGYGDEDQGAIPPNSTLHFEIELLATGTPGV